MFLLQTQALNANDIMFRVTDVIFIVSGVITLLTAWFAFKSAQAKTDNKVESLGKEINDRIVLEVARGDEKRLAIKREFEIFIAELKRLYERIRDTENSLDTIEVDLGKKMDAFSGEIQKVNLSIMTMKTEILERLLDKK